MPPAILTVEVSRTIAQPADLVRRQFLDIAHHIRRGVHPGIAFTLHSQNETETRYQLAQSVLGWRLVDEYRSSLTSAGTVLGEVLSGSHAGMCTEIFFEATSPTQTFTRVRLQTPVSGWAKVFKPLYGAAIRWSLARALAQDGRDLDAGNYPSAV